MAILSAFNKDTAKNMQLDAGILVLNLKNPESFAGEIPAGAILVGATEGGSNFKATPEIRNLFDGIDGARGNYKDGNAIDSWEILLTATAKEITASNLKTALAAADITTTDGGKYDTLVPRMDIKTTDYLSNICWLGTMNGSTDAMIIELRNVMNTSGIDFTATDKGTGSVAMEFKAHFDLTNPNDVPFRIHFPKKTVVKNK